jgi:hypothetical protein
LGIEQQGIEWVVDPGLIDKIRSLEVLGVKTAEKARLQRFARTGQHRQSIEGQGSGNAGGAEHFEQVPGEAKTGDIGAGGGPCGRERYRRRLG